MKLRKYFEAKVENYSIGVKSWLRNLVATIRTLLSFRPFFVPFITASGKSTLKPFGTKISTQNPARANLNAYTVYLFQTRG